MNGHAKSFARSPRRFDLPALVLVNAVWGSTDVVAKYAVAEMTPAVLAWTRFSFALIALLPVFIIRRSEIPRTVRGLAPFVALGACGFFLNFVFHYHGLRLSNASHATALRISEALVIMALSAVVLRERIGGRAAAGLALGIGGVLLVLDLRPGSLSLFSSGCRLGDLLIMAGIVVEAFYTIIGKKVLLRTRPLTATALSCMFGWLMLTAFLGPGISRELAAAPPSWKALLACAYLGLAATAVGYWVWYRVLARNDSHRVGMTIMVQPVVGIPLAALLMADRLTGGFVAGTALIAAGVYLAFSRGASVDEASGMEAG